MVSDSDSDTHWRCTLDRPALLSGVLPVSCFSSLLLCVCLPSSFSHVLMFASARCPSPCAVMARVRSIRFIARFAVLRTGRITITITMGMRDMNRIPAGARYIPHVHTHTHGQTEGRQPAMTNRGRASSDERPRFNVTPFLFLSIRLNHPLHCQASLI